MSVKKIAVLTSGGDAPGMNAAVRAVTRSALAEGIEVVGVYRGYNGLMNKEIVNLTHRSVSDIIQRGGTMLYTARSPLFRKKEGVELAAKNCREMGVDGVVVIGGDGSFRGARDLTAAGIPCIGIPGTIDNDISFSDYTIGYDTAMNTAMEMIDRIRDTAQSHDRCSVVEVMGRNAGYIALNTGIACGATCILVPELEYDFEKDIIARIKTMKARGKQHFIVIVAEGVGHCEELSNKIQAELGIESRATILGHVQRGGAPTVQDRVMASHMGYRAVQLLKEGKSNRVVGTKAGKIIDEDITTALDTTKTLSREEYEVAMTISI